MPGRQVTFFRIGSWLAILTALVHLAGHVLGGGEATNDTENTLIELATTYRFTFPDGAERTLVDIMDGLNLSYVALLMVLGTIGLLVSKRGRHDAVLMTAVSRAAAVGGVVLLVISLNHWFLTPSILTAMMTLAFAFAAVKAPERDAPSS